MEKILNEIKEALENVTEINELNDIKVKYMGKKGVINDLTSKLKDLTVEEKKTFGQQLNELKSNVTIMLDEKRNEIEKKKLDEKLKNEKIDISLPATKIPVGCPNILENFICFTLIYPVKDL